MPPLQGPKRGEQESLVLRPQVEQKSATSSIPMQDALTHPANIVTPAKAVERRDMVITSAQMGVSSEGGMQPKYLQYNLWGADQSLLITIAEWSESAIPLPRPPMAELENTLFRSALASSPHLFAVITPLNVDHFEILLVAHPNRPFVSSILTGLHEGFWPWADTLKDGYPNSFFQRPMGIYQDEHWQFFHSQLTHEQAHGHYSSLAEQHLLPGMYCMPIYAVPKPDSADFRLVNDYSTGPFSPNSMIKHRCVMGYPFDNLHQLGQMLLDLQANTPGLDLVVWKSDIAEAY